MKRNNLGQSGLRVAPIGLGTLTWGQDTELADAQRMLTTLLDSGGNLVDISPMYGKGFAEEILGECLDGIVDRDDVVIAAHAGISWKNGHLVRDTSRRGLISSLEKTLSTLKTTHVDVLHLAAPDPHTPFDETIDTLANFVQQGAVRYIGLANHRGWQIARVAQYLKDARLPHLTAISADYSLLNRDLEYDVSECAHSFGLGIIAQAPLAGGVLTGKYRRTIPPTSRAATEHLGATVNSYLDDAHRRIVEGVVKAADGLGRTPTDVSLTWLLSQPSVAAVLVGARTAAQFDQLMSLDFSDLPTPVTNVLSEISQ